MLLINNLSIMKFKVFFLVLFISTTSFFAQTNSEIANVYLNRAEASYFENKIDESLKFFDKAMKYITEIKESRVAKIGMLLHYKIKDYQKAKIFSKQYFDLEINKNTDDYQYMLDVYVNIDEALEAQKAEDERLQRERIAAEKRKRHLDSMTVIWNAKADELVLKFDAIKPLLKEQRQLAKEISKERKECKVEVSIIRPVNLGVTSGTRVTYSTGQRQAWSILDRHWSTIHH